MNTLTRTTDTATAPERREVEAALLPPVDVIEDRSGITLWADLPGASRESLHLRVDGDLLAIEAELHLGASESLEATHTEVALPLYRRSFTLSKELDAEQVSAELSHGVLRLRTLDGSGLRLSRAPSSP